MKKNVRMQKQTVGVQEEITQIEPVGPVL